MNIFKRFFKNRNLIQWELELYKKEKFLEIDKSVEDYRSKRQAEIEDMAKRCHEELGVYEHEYHWTKEQKGIELAKLQAKIEGFTELLKVREECIKANQILLNSKADEIKRLNDIVNLLINKQPQHTTTIQQLK